jgi:hypothetical protein
MPIAANRGLEVVYLVDRWGWLIFGAESSGAASGAYEAPPSNLDPAAWPFAASVLEGEADDSGDKFAGIEQAGAQRRY